MAAVKGLLRHLARHGIAVPDAVAVTLEGAHAVPSGPTRLVESVESDELYSMLRVCRNDPQRNRGRRDAALVALLAGTGARRAEVVTLERRNVDLVAGIATFKVKGRRIPQNGDPSGS